VANVIDDDIFVINAVTHAFNFEPDNVQPNKAARMVRDMLGAMHFTWQDGSKYSVEKPEDLLHDWSVDSLAKTLFLESPVDMGVTHTLRLDSYFRDGLARREKMVEAVRTYPNRFLGYVGLDPTRGLEVCLRELEEQLDELPEAVGLKMYPAQVEPIRGWRMDDEDLMFPIYEMAQQRGLKTVAIHKAIPMGPVPMNPYRIDDVDGAAIAFPDLSFEIIHAGMAFINETGMAVARFPNVYANLEGTMQFLTKSPKLFEEIMGNFLMWGGPEKILFADGCMCYHSRPLIEALMDFEFSDETLNGLGIPQITREDKAGILGGNIARILDIDIEKAKAAIAGDVFDEELKRTGMQPPYSNWRAEIAAMGDRHVSDTMHFGRAGGVSGHGVEVGAGRS
jgi:uncharacterized protein